MNCSHCGQSLETGAAFCGNCGQPVVAVAADPSLAVVAGQQLPAYAVPLPGQHRGETKALLSLIFGLLSLVVIFFVMIVAGLAIAIVGLVLATLSRHSTKRRLSTVGLIVSIIAIVVALGFWAALISRNQDHKKLGTAPASSTAQSAASLDTPCYKVSFQTSLNVDNTAGSCEMQAFNADTLNDSSNVYKVYTNSLPQINDANFAGIAKQAIEKDVAENLPSFSITSEGSDQFAGSPAYLVDTSNGSGLAVIEAAVLHTSSNGENFYVMVHGQSGSTTDLSGLEKGWQWK